MPGDGRQRPSSAFADDKAQAIRSYAEFCEAGKIPAYPLELFLEISNICDLKCAMCVQFSALNANRLNQIKGTARGFMDQGEVSENLREALRHAVLVHCFGYGEPTIHPTFKSFLDLVARYEVMIDFFTNGMHLDEEFCQFLVDKNVYKITVSFSGSTKETYENIYLGGNFEKVLGGMKCLAELKKKRGTRYPIIEVNSLAFRDHVAHFDEFVGLMADHGVDVVMLKPLQPHKVIPELYEHVSIMRPHQEGEIVKRAIKIGARRGITVNADLYANTASKGSGYEQQVAALKAEAEEHFGDSGREFGGNPLSRFDSLAESLEPIRASGTEKRDPRVIGLDAPRVVSRALLKVKQPAEEAGATDPFYCMEPFKTLYISRNGAAKPCCFANPEGWYLGDAKRDDALAIWGGEGFDATRSAIAEGEYPMKSCEVCLRRKSGPRGHFANHLLNSYLDWHGYNFDQNLHATVEAQSPGFLSRGVRAHPEDLMARVRKAGTGTSTAASIEALWPAKQETTADTGTFIATNTFYAHRDFVSDEPLKLNAGSGAATGVSPEFQRLLRTCATAHYRGQGSIVDLGAPSPAIQGVLEGLRANPEIDAIAASFDSRRDQIIERFAAAAGANDLVGGEKFIKAYVGDVSKLRWLSSKPIEMCVVQAGTRAVLFQRALVGLLPFFVVGQTLLVQSDFYLQSSLYPKVLMGYLGGSFEWLGQMGLGAVFRYVRPVPRDLAFVDPYRSLPAELSLRFHRQWQNPKLPRAVQMRLGLSYAQLLSEVSGRDAARAYLDTVEEQYRGLLQTRTGEESAFARMLSRHRQMLER